jgi:resuscitation-promoting factor RpfB
MIHRLYHSHFKPPVWSTVFLYLLLLNACSPPRLTQDLIQISLLVDGKAIQVQMPAGSNVQEVLSKTGITLSSLDRIEPPIYTILRNEDEIKVVRVTEEFEIEQVVIPFERQVLRNETLPEGETRLSQPGMNGLMENTFRRVYEDGNEIARSIVRSVVVQEAVPEIVMVGSQTPFLSLSIPGRLAYLSAGNAWVMEGTTGDRRPVVTSGDLDGRVFKLSPDGRWLLYSRATGDSDTINSLWASRVDENSTVLVDFKVENIIHFAQFGPDSSTVAFSTVEPRTTAPGWQANNDLHLVSLSNSGFLGTFREIFEPNSGGVYGWWGMDIAWGPDLDQMAYARPDGVGTIELGEAALSFFTEIIPFQTGGDWAWVPGLNWSPDGKYLFTVGHTAPEGSQSPETSQQFDLLAIPVEAGATIKLVTQVGMFAYPVSSPIQTPLQEGERSETVNNDYQIAFLQAIFPSQSETSRYRLAVMDRDGSNRRVIFPSDGEPGLDPQEVIWSPEPVGVEGSYMLAMVYQDNIWLVNVKDGQAQQITGDGLISRIDWR